MLQIGLGGRITNEEVFKKIRERNCVWKSTEHIRTRLLGHILKYESLIKTVLEATVEERGTGEDHTTDHEQEGREQSDYRKPI